MKFSLRSFSLANRPLGVGGGVLLLTLLGSTVLLAAGPSHAQRHPLSDHMLIVYNENDPESAELARFYAEQRQIDEGRLLGLKTPLAEEIGRAAFMQTILIPIDRHLRKQGWLKRRTVRTVRNGQLATFQAAEKNDIWCIVLMRGVPLKIRPDPTIQEPVQGKPELLRNEASVDSELATLPIIPRPRSGLVPNHYFFEKTPRAFEQEDALRMIMVVRLDGPTPDDVRRMIRDSIAAEDARLAGTAYVDTRGLKDPKNPYSQGDDWLRSVYQLLERKGWPVELDERGDLFEPNLPWNEVALYFGWYTQKARGPLFHSPRRFARGAVAYHIHSFSASTVRSTTSAWVGPFINAGAAATMGSVYEPYLDLTPHVDRFADRLLRGFTFAEAAYASQKGLSWMVVMVGDPLYRPFKLSLVRAEGKAFKSRTPNYEWLKLQFVRRQLALDTKSPTLGTLRKKLINSRSSAISYEALSDLLREWKVPRSAEAVEAGYRSAMQLSTSPVDQIRNGQKLRQFLETSGRSIDAEKVREQLVQRWPKQAQFYGLIPEQPEQPEVPTALPVDSGTSPQPAAAAKPQSPPSQGEQRVTTSVVDDYPSATTFSTTTIMEQRRNKLAPKQPPRPTPVPR